MAEDMDMDLTQFYALFFEQCAERLDAAEAALRNLDPEDPDSEEIGVLFRAAHTISGDSATLGFEDLAEFTQVMEVALSKVSTGKRPVTDELIETMLAAVACLRDVAKASESESPIDSDRVSEMIRQMQALG